MIKAVRQEFYKKVCDLFVNKNYSVKEIAEIFEVQTGNIYRVLKANNINVKNFETRLNNSIINDYKNGIRIRDLALKYDKPMAYINFVLARNNIERRGTPQEKQLEMYDNIKTMLAQGYSQSEIAKNYNVSRQYISKVFNKFREDKESE